MTSTDEEGAFESIGAWSGFSEYRGALVLPVDPAGRCLLQLRDRGAPVHPGEWGFFGGEVEQGETLREAAARELEEETGLVVEPDALKPFARLVSPGSGKRLFLYEWETAAAPADIRLGEGGGFGFIEPRDFPSMPILAAARIFLAAWLRSRRGP